MNKSTIKHYTIKRLNESDKQNRQIEKVVTFEVTAINYYDQQIARYNFVTYQQLFNFFLRGL